MQSWRDKVLTQDDADRLQHSRSVELYRLCEQYGYTQPHLAGYEMRSTFKMP